MKTVIKIWLKLSTPIECYLSGRKPSATLERILGQNPYYIVHDFNNKLWRKLDKMGAAS